MVYAILSNSGAVVGAYGSPQPDGTPNYAAMESTDARWTTYQAALAAAGVKAGVAAQFSPTDYQMSRWLEDLTEILLSKGTLELSDIPTAAAANINARRALRGEPALS